MTVTTPRQAGDLGTEEARAIGVEAYIFLSRWSHGGNPAADDEHRGRSAARFGPMNAFNHMRAFPPVEFKAVPWANAGTLYSLAWLDVTSTPVVWVMGRTQTNGPADYEAVRKVQDGFAVTPLSRWGQAPQPVAVPVDPGVDISTPPVEQVTALPAADFFAKVAELLKVHPPRVTDSSILARMRDAQ